MLPVICPPASGSLVASVIPVLTAVTVDFLESPPSLINISSLPVRVFFAASADTLFTP